MERHRQSFALGDLHPCGSPHGPAELRVECPLEGLDPKVEVTVRICQAVAREVLDVGGDPVEELLVAGRLYRAGAETMEREVRLVALPDRTATIRTAGSELAELTEKGVAAGALRWRWEPMHGTVEAWTEELRNGLSIVQVAVANRMEWDDADPGRSAMRAMHATEVELYSAEGALASYATPAAA